MRFVIDTSALASKETQTFLANPANQVMLSEDVFREALRSGTIEQFLKQMRLLFRHRHQVYMLRSFRDTIRLSGNMSNIALQLIDNDQTTNFRSNALHLLVHGPAYNLVLDHLIDIKNDVQDNWNARFLKVGNLEAYISHLRTVFSVAELKVITGGGTLPRDISVKITELAVDNTAEFARRANFNLENPTTYENGYNFPLFRVCLINVCSLIDFLGNGDKHRNRHKVLNDTTDGIVSMMGTYFDGVLSSDKFLGKIHIISRTNILLNGGQVPETPITDCVVPFPFELPAQDAGG